MADKLLTPIYLAKSGISSCNADSFKDCMAPEKRFFLGNDWNPGQRKA
jgi:hypothetical protein